ncbi:MAG: hypothetical protein GY811_19175 [Myxococcales bacterium]|nr:hypothetical protein [Myxococcales bacterium]
MMAKGFFTESPLIFYPVLALVLFLVTFTFITIRTLRSSNESLQHVAGLPLIDEPIVHVHEKDHGHE